MMYTTLQRHLRFMGCMVCSVLNRLKPPVGTSQNVQHHFCRLNGNPLAGGPMEESRRGRQAQLRRTCTETVDDAAFVKLCTTKRAT